MFASPKQPGGMHLDLQDLQDKGPLWNERIGGV